MPLGCRSIWKQWHHLHFIPSFSRWQFPKGEASNQEPEQVSLVLKFICASLWYVCMRVARGRCWLNCSPSDFETRSLTKSGAHCLAKLAGWWTLGLCLLSPGITGEVCQNLFYHVSSGDLNSGPLVWKTSSLLTELSSLTPKAILTLFTKVLLLLNLQTHPSSVYV